MTRNREESRLKRMIYLQHQRELRTRVETPILCPVDGSRLFKENCFSNVLNCGNCGYRVQEIIQ